MHQEIGIEVIDFNSDYLPPHIFYIYIELYMELLHRYMLNE